MRLPYRKSSSATSETGGPTSGGCRWGASKGRVFGDGSWKAYKKLLDGGFVAFLKKVSGA